MLRCSGSSKRSWIVFNPDGDLHLKLMPSVPHALLICGVHLLGVTGALLSSAMSDNLSFAVLALLFFSLLDSLQKQVLRSHPDAIVEVKRERGRWWLRSRRGLGFEAELAGQRYVGARFSVLRFKSLHSYHQVVLARGALTPAIYRHCYVALKDC